MAGGPTPFDLCPGTSSDLFEAYFDCICDAQMGNCTTECMTTCTGGPPSMDCDMCADMNCSAELSACMADM